jgi:hypothetical protein
MTAKRRDKEGEPVPNSQGKPETRPELGFDRWLGKQLHGLYDPILNEDVPEDIVKLIECFSRRDSEPRGGAKS